MTLADPSVNSSSCFEAESIDDIKPDAEFKSAYSSFDMCSIFEKTCDLIFLRVCISLVFQLHKELSAYAKSHSHCALQSGSSIRQSLTNLPVLELINLHVPCPKQFEMHDFRGTAHDALMHF